MKLTIIVPVYNEEKTIGKVLEKLFTIRLSCAIEIIVIDDGSTDNTKKVVSSVSKSQIKNHADFRMLFHQNNLGKGQALKSGFEHASGNYILVQDADFEYDPDDIPKLLAPILHGKKRKSKRNTVAVYGSRFKNNRNVMPKAYYWGNKFLTLMTNILFGCALTDMETGYKLLPASFIKDIIIKSKHFDIEPEITAKLIKNNIPIVEVPISYLGRTHLAGKKLTALDAFEAIKALFYFRFGG